MNRFNPETLAQDTNGIWHGDVSDLKINGFSNDTRTIQNNEIFLAIKTSKRDGHDFLQDAQSRGASAAIVERIVPGVSLPQLKVDDTLLAFQKTARAHRDLFPGKVVGVTGSCGKTTTKDWITCLLGKDHTHATHQNLNNVLGVPLTLTGVNPICHKYAVIEAGMNMIGEMDVMAPMISADLAVITTVAPVHLEMVGSIEDVAKQKAMLGDHAAPSSMVLFPERCLQYKPFKNFQSRARILVKDKSSVQGYADNQIIAYSIQENDSAITLSIALNQRTHQFTLPILSDGMLSNAALAIAAASLLGIAPEAITERIQLWKPAQHRGEQYEYNDQYYYADCYNANPVAMQDAFGIFQKKANPNNPYCYVLGCMGELGEYANHYHSETAKKLSLRPNDQVLLIGPHAPAYKDGLLAAGNAEAQIFILNSTEDLRNMLSQFSGNIFLKGSKSYKLWELIPESAQRIERQIAPC